MADQHPNILFITADQLRADALGCYGNPVIDTPNIDALAAGGVRFARMFAAYPVCAPNRASIVTGRYPSVHRLRTNGKRLPQGEVTLMEVLRQRAMPPMARARCTLARSGSLPADGCPSWTRIRRRRSTRSRIRTTFPGTALTGSR